MSKEDMNALDQIVKHQQPYQPGQHVFRAGDQRMLSLLGKSKAEEKLAAFLLSLSTRFKPRGLSATNFNLPMSRQDIGNYLGLVIETVSRLFTRFQEDGLLKVNRREVTITDLPQLKGMVEGCVNTPAVKAGGAFTISP
jgi:CRP/FNR family transcriptional regulator